MIDAHIHYADSIGADRLNRLIEEQQLSAIALQCIPKGSLFPMEADAFAFRKQCPVPVYVFGGLDREIYKETSPDAFSIAADAQITSLMNMGCTGIKMLEGKPDVRKACGVPDFDCSSWTAYWNRLEEEQIPVYMHVNDPEEFWDADNVAEYVKQAGWFYDETFINNEEQYGQILTVLEQFPKLRILFPHFFFMSMQLDRLTEIMHRFPNVRIDLTPGIELYYNLSSQRERAVQFFYEFQDRILYGTDMGARALIKTTPVLLSLDECRSRVKLIRDFLETKGDYMLCSDGFYVLEREPAVMHGLGLPEEILYKIYEQNFLAFIKR